MSDLDPDLDQPVTRRELRAELSQLEARMDERFDPLEAVSIKLLDDVAGLKTDVAGLKTDVAGLKTDVAGLKTDVAGLKTDVAGLKTDVAGLKTDFGQLRGEMIAGFATMRSEMASFFKAIQEDTRRYFVALDDKYQDLPSRVSKLEHTVFAPKPPRRARGR